MRLFHYILSLPITLYVNFRVLPFHKAIRLPLLVDYRTCLKGIRRNCIIVPKYPKFASIKIGWGNGSLGNHVLKENFILINGNGYLIFDGKAQFALGVTLRSDNGGVIYFGDNFTANQNFTCFVNTEIKFGQSVLIGWDVNVRDSDGHKILNEDNILINPNKKIYIGNHVWLASHVNILKGALISDNSIVGFGSLVTKKFNDANVIIAGIPACVVKKDIHWIK